MLDHYGRKIDYARISVTEHCNLNCVYCMPEKPVPEGYSGEILSYENILRICRCFAASGITKFKITGGEPLVRPNLVSFIHNLKEIHGIEKVTITTNGSSLPVFADSLKKAGINGINISLDALEPALYRRITGGGNIQDVLNGLKAVDDLGFSSIKINCVPIKGLNESELVNIARLAENNNIHVRFIEIMPIGYGKYLDGIPQAEIFELFENVFGKAVFYENCIGNGPAIYYSFQGFKGKIGFIGAISQNFCGLCNRIRLTADGNLKTCLHQDIGIPLNKYLSQTGDEQLLEAIKHAVLKKPVQHLFGIDDKHEKRLMSQIGG